MPTEVADFAFSRQYVSPRLRREGYAFRKGTRVNRREASPGLLGREHLYSLNLTVKLKCFVVRFRYKT